MPKGKGIKRRADAAPATGSVPAAKKAKKPSKDEIERFINAPLSAQMRSFCLAHPHLADIAKKRDKLARAELGEDRYTLYRQGSYCVIKARALADFDPTTEAYAADVNKTLGRASTLCSACDKWVADFNTRHKHTHGRNPGKQILCFVCGDILSRTDKITVDEHLATSHMVFVNLDGRAGDLLRATEGGVFKSDHLGPGLARSLIKKQFDNLVRATGRGVERLGKSTCAEVRTVARKLGGKVPSAEYFTGLDSEETLELLRDVRRALREIDGNFEWEGIGGVEETPMDWSDPEDAMPEDAMPEDKAEERREEAPQE